MEVSGEKVYLKRNNTEREGERFLLIQVQFVKKKKKENQTLPIFTNVVNKSKQNINKDWNVMR